jgi:hypothetical protein
VATYVAEQKNLLVFPNPASSVVNLQYTSVDQGVITLQLLDMNGRLISNLTGNFKPGTTTEHVDLSKLANAGYILQVTIDPSGASSTTHSFNIQKIK